MKKRMMSVVGVAVAIVTVSAFGESSDAPYLLSPNGTAASVAIHTDAQKVFLSKSMADRRAYAMTAVGREAMRTEATGRWPNAKQSDNSYAMSTSGTFPQWVTLTWTGDGPFTVEVFRKADGKLFFQQTNVYTEFAQVFNCELDTEYVWRVSNAAGISETATFKTDNVFPRLLWDHDELGQIYGVRDLGGAKGRHGLVVRQGLLIRSSDPMKGATSYAMDTAFWTGTALDGLGIRCELDLRSAEETGYATESAFGEGVIYDNDEINSYQDIFEADETAAFKAALDVALNPENYPLNFHGEIGMDRTGSLALVLEALLGMSKDDIMRDYESSWFWYKPNDRPMDEAYNQIDRLLTCVENFDGSTFNAKVASYCFSIGVTQAQLDAFRTAMLGEGGAAPTEDDASIARGDVDFVTLPTGMTGYSYVVSNLTADTEIRPDNGGRYALPIGAKVGIYAVAEAGYAIVGTNPYVIDEVTIDTVIDASALPMALPPRVVTLGDHPHMTAAWTSGDGSVTNVIDGTGFKVAWGTTNGKVIFTAESGWEIVGDAVVELGTVTENVVFGGESEYHVPEVAIADPCLVAFGRGSLNMAVAWTSGDGSVTNAVANKVKAMYVPRGSENVRIICTANPGYELVGESVFDLGTVTDDFTFGQGNDFVFPIAYDIAANVVYLDWDEANGRMTNAVARAGYWRSVEDSEMACAMKGCMVVTNDVTIPIAQVAGAAVLVLCNDATLTVTGTGDEAGIHVPANASLTITVRKGSTGRVVAQGGADCAGIGSQFKQGSGSVLGAVRIVAGTVTATAGKNGAGIGNGFYGKDGSVKIFGGAVTAVGGVGAASDIGDGGNPYSPCLVSISGGIFARPVQEAWCADRFAVFDNLDPATKSDYPYAVLPASTLTIGKCPIHVSAAWTSVSPERSESPSGDGYQGCDGSVTNAIEDGSVVMRDGTPNVRVIFTVDDGYALDNAAVVDLGTVTGDVTFGIGNDYKVPHAVPTGAVSYLDWDAESETLTNATVAAGEWTLVTDETRTLNDGWYVVAYDVVLPVGSNIVVNGSARLILCDGARLSVTGGYDQAAIEVSRTDAVTNSLAIYGQAECTGRLTAQGGGNHGAGIGTGLYGNCGALTINGGTVTANGGFGNGWFGRDGLVAINDGKVTASGIKGCSAVIRGGIFGMSVQDAWCADHHGVFRNLDPATCTEFPYAVLPAWKVTIGDRRYMTVGWTSDDELMTNAVEGTSFKVRHGERNVRVIFTVDSEYVLAGDPVVDVGTVNSDIVFGIGNDFKAPHAGVPYLDWDETNRVMTNAVSPVVCDVYSTSIRDLQDGHWYVVKGEHTIREYSGLRVSGDVHIILCDGSSLSIVLQKHTDGDLVTEPGIEVGEGSSLTVYGQVNGSGRLVAVGGDGGAAGIGGEEKGACGAVTINGGEVSSAGGSDYGGGASGIGTGDGGYGGSVTINGGKVTATGGADCASIKGDNVTINDGAINVGNMGGVIAVFGGVFWAQPQDGWLATARSVVPNMDLTTADTHPWRVVESATVVSLDAPIGPFDTAEEATNAMATAAFAPSEEIVSRILLRGVSPRRYSEKFGFGVTSKGEGEWYVEAALTDAAKAYLAETATNATRQIPVAEIAEYDDETIHGFWVQDCEPGFYYTLYCADDVRSLPEKGTKCGPEMCFEDGKLMFNWVDKPSDAAGFFTIGVSAAKGE